MPLVFVHGVAVRSGPSYDAGVAVRDALLRRYVLARHHRDDGAPVTILNPFWGELGGRLHWSGASLPLEDVEALGGDDADLVALDASATPPDTTEAAAADARVLAVARRSLPEAVDLLWSAAALAAAAQPAATLDDDAAHLAALAAPVARYAAANPEPAWLDEVRTDTELLTRLEREVEAFAPPGAVAEAPGPVAPGAEAAVAPAVPAEAADEWESLGIGSAWQALRRGLGRFNAAVTGVVGRTASDRLRPAVVPPLVKFLGDVFVYLHQQSGAAGPIRDRVAAAIREAAALAEPSDPLVVVAHSMGGNIVYDLLTEELADVPVALLVTAGTQVSFFEELKLFRCSDPDVPAPGATSPVARPANVARWINVFDYADVLGFRLGSVIDGVEDFSYGTGSLLKAHTEYYLQPSFYERLGAHL